MTSLFAVLDPVWTKESVMAPTSSNAEPKATLLQILERAADDPTFIAQLTENGSKALRGYDLNSEEEAALLSGDLTWIETHVGKLNERMKVWLECRLQQEIW